LRAIIFSQGAMLRGKKGQAIILKALPQYIQKFPEIRYLMAGDGGAKEGLMNLVIQLDLQEHVYFAGMVQPISTLLKISDLAILPSIVEPLGLFQIES
jgi:glycosyltransferase involved in cell wall biosynthesis